MLENAHLSDCTPMQETEVARTVGESIYTLQDKGKRDQRKSNVQAMRSIVAWYVRAWIT
jgi:hypothetical protein